MSDFQPASPASAPDHLPMAKSFTLAHNEIERPLGINDAARGPLQRFAGDHNCIIAYTDGCVVFHKLRTDFRGRGGRQ